MDSGRDESKRRRIEEEGAKIESLPREIAVDILSRLSITCLIRFGSACRAWRALARDPDLVRSQLRRASETNPCLVFHCDYPIRNQLCFADLSKDNSMINKKKTVRKFRTPFWERMPEFDVIGSCNGLLCLVDSLYNDAVFVYNPFTGESRELPRARQYPDQEAVFGFGFHPVTGKYKVVRIVYYRSGPARRLGYPQSAVEVLTADCLSWKSMGKVPHQLFRRPCEALVNGRLHWVTRPRRYHPARRIISFDLELDHFQEILRPDECDALNKCNFHLVALRGCLSAVVNCAHGKLEIWTMKEYGAKQSWTREFSIGAYLFKGPKHNVDRSVKIWKNSTNGRVVLVLCILQNGDILLEYKGRALVSYDPKCRKFKDVAFQGMPDWFHTVVHSGNLNWVDTKFDD